MTENMCYASQYQSLPAYTGYSHSIVNEPFFRFSIYDLLVCSGGNTMKSTMLKKSFQILGKIAN